MLYKVTHNNYTHSIGQGYCRIVRSMYVRISSREGIRSGFVVYHTRISYRTRMVHTVRVYAYGTTVRVWYGYLYHMRIAVLYYCCLQATYI